MENTQRPGKKNNDNEGRDGGPPHDAASAADEVLASKNSANQRAHHAGYRLGALLASAALRGATSGAVHAALEWVTGGLGQDTGEES